MRLLLLTLLVCAGPAWGRLCDSGTFRSSERELCSPCTICSAGDVQLFPCQPFQDTLCEPARRVPPAPVTSEEAHRSRLAEERVRADLARARDALHVERTRLETLVFEWQTTVLVVSVLVTLALVLSFVAVLCRRSRAVVRKGVEDYSHLILNREDEHRDSNDQSSLAYADFDKIKIGRRPFDSPYSDLSSPRTASSRATTTCAASVNVLPQNKL